jgi:hypothetical protein
MKPNLFTFATQELSQDAFIAWLIQWADPACREQNTSLHEAAVDFVKRLISLQLDAPAEITKVVAGRQWENIDVWAEINYTYLLVIEDKVGTGQHSDQLTRYREIADKWCRDHAFRPVYIYLKTQSDSATSLSKVSENGFAIFGRSNFLEFLEAHDVRNDIYADFREQLRSIEDRERAYTQRSLKDWGADDWKGFYQLLERSRHVVNWGYTPNPAGGFWGAVLNWTEHGDYCPYMQIEEGSLCFKVGEVYSDRGCVRDHYHQLLMNHGGPALGLQRPQRFGSGTYMTVAVVPRSAWLGGDDEVLDANAVVENLNGYESWLLALLKESPPINQINPAQENASL